MTTDLSAITGRTAPSAAPALASAGDARDDFRSLVAALQSGNIDEARAALGSIREDPPATAAGAAATPRSKDVRGEPLTVLDQLAYSQERGAEATQKPQDIDYKKFSGMTPFQVYMANPNGLPQGWDWGAWADAVGQPNPENLDVSGSPLAAPVGPGQPFERTQASFDWNRTGAYLAREGGDGSMHTMTITPPAGWTGGIELFGSQGPSALGGVSTVKYVVTDAAGSVVASDTMTSAAGDLRFAASGAQGPYTVTVTYSGAGLQNFNCLHFP